MYGSDKGEIVMKKLTKRRISAPLIAVSTVAIYLFLSLMAGGLIGIAGMIMGKTQDEITAAASSGIPDEICMGLAALCSVFIVRSYSKTGLREVFHVKKFDIAVPIMLLLFTWGAGELFDHFCGLVLSNFMTVEPNSTPFTGLFGAICMVIFAPIFEEIIFRFAGTELPRGAYSLPIVCIANGLYFAAVHGYNIQGFLHIIIVGASMAYVFCKTRNLFYTMITHALNNLLCLIPIGDFAYHEKNGFVLGNWYWLLINAVLLAIALIYYIKVFRKKYTSNYFEIDRETGLPKNTAAEETSAEYCYRENGMKKVYANE